MGRINKRESELKSQLMTHIKTRLPGFVAIRHEDIRSGGTPDLSTTGAGKTLWWEVKHATPRITSDGRQELICLRLSAAGFCRYIIYWEKGEEKRTLIVHPRRIHDLHPEESWHGHSHQFVVDYMSRAHGV